MYMDLPDQREFYEWLQALDTNKYGNALAARLQDLKRWKPEDFGRVLRQAIETYPSGNPNAILEVTATETDILESGDLSCLLLTAWLDAYEGDRLIQESAEVQISFRPGGEIGVYWPEADVETQLR